MRGKLSLKYIKIFVKGEFSLIQKNTDSKNGKNKETAGFDLKYIAVKNQILIA